MMFPPFVLNNDVKKEKAFPKLDNVYPLQPER